MEGGSSSSSGSSEVAAQHGRIWRSINAAASRIWRSSGKEGRNERDFIGIIKGTKRINRRRRVLTYDDDGESEDVVDGREEPQRGHGEDVGGLGVAVGVVLALLSSLEMLCCCCCVSEAVSAAAGRRNETEIEDERKGTEEKRGWRRHLKG